MEFKTYNKNKKSLTVENLNMKLLFQTEFIQPQEGSLPLHKQFHKHSYIEIFVCLRGEISIKTSKDVIPLGSGDMAMVPSAVEHFKIPESLPDTEWLGMGFVCRELQVDFNNDLYGRFSGILEYPEIIVYKNVPKICELVSECNRKKDEDEISSVLALLSELIKLPVISKSVSAQLDENAQKSKNIDRLLKLDDIINTNFTADFSNKEIADLLFISERQLSRIVAQNYDMPLRTLIMKKRLDIAAELLVTTDETVDHIASSVGFKNINSFYREFKKRFSMTPSEYRKELQK